MHCLTQYHRRINGRGIGRTRGCACLAVFGPLSGGTKGVVMAKVLVSMNAFKGSISTKAATDAVALAFEGAGFQVEKVYLADGGDGTIDVAAALGGRVEFVQSFDPLMRPIEAPV